MDAINKENIASLTSAMRLGQVTGDFMPAVYVLEPTNHCNVSCIMCPNQRFNASELGNMDLGVADRLLDAISPYAELVMLYFLGESTLHPEFNALLKLARSRISGKLVLSTNLLSLSDETINAIAQHVDIVIACVDRWDSAAYESIRRGSTFETVIRNAERLLEARGKGASPLVLVKALDLSPTKEQASSQAEKDAFSTYWKLRGAIPLWGWVNTWAGQMPKLGNLTTLSNPYAMRSRSPCADLWFKMVINWRGVVAQCCHDWRSRNTFGNVSPENLREIWHSPEIIELRRSHLEKNFQFNDLCRTCREWGEFEELESYIRLSDDDFFRVF